MVRVIARVGRLLDAFTPERPELTLTEAAQAADLNKSSAHRLLASLEAVGLVERHESSWRVGAKTVALAMVRLGRIDLRRETLPHLRGLRDSFRAAVAFSVPDGADMIYLERLDSPDAYGVSARLGGRAPIWAGASGKAVLACMTASARASRLDNEEWQRLPPDVRRRVLGDIEVAERRGYSIDKGDFFNGIGGVAAAIREADGAPAGAISVIIPSERLTEQYATAIADRLLISVRSLEGASALGPS